MFMQPQPILKHTAFSLLMDKWKAAGPFGSDINGADSLQTQTQRPISTLELGL